MVAPLERNVCQLYTHFFESSKCHEVTMDGIECDEAPFNVISRRPTPEIGLSRKNFKLDYSGYFKYLY